MASQVPIFRLKQDNVSPSHRYLPSRYKNISLSIWHLLSLLWLRGCTFVLIFCFLMIVRRPAGTTFGIKMHNVSPSHRHHPRRYKNISLFLWYLLDLLKLRGCTLVLISCFLMELGGRQGTHFGIKTHNVSPSPCHLPSRYKNISWSLWHLLSLLLPSKCTFVLISCLLMELGDLAGTHFGIKMHYVVPSHRHLPSRYKNVSWS